MNETHYVITVENLTANREVCFGNVDTFDSAYSRFDSACECFDSKYKITLEQHTILPKSEGGLQIKVIDECIGFADGKLSSWFLNKHPDKQGG